MSGRNTNRYMLGIGFALGIFFCWLTVAHAQQQRIVGVVTAEYQIITDASDVYVLADDDMTTELMAYVGKTVMVTGSVTDQEDNSIIQISEFEVLDE